jgi:hypothetical protein
VLDRAAGAPPGRQRQLARRADRRLARLRVLVQRRLGGDCALGLEDMLERASQCAICPPGPGPVDDHPGDDHPGTDD